MEWNAARLKFTVLSGQKEPGSAAAQPALAPQRAPLTELSFGQLCKLGLALTWPLALAALGIFVILLVFLLR